MSAVPYPEPEEPDGSGLGGDGGDADDGGWDENAGEGVQQGLFITLPAEELNLEGFSEGGRADTMAPGPLLSTIVGVVAGDHGADLASLADDQLIGFLSGVQRMESWITWAKMAAVNEFAARPRKRDNTAADQIAFGLNLTWLTAMGEVSYASAVARRLPVTFAALYAGTLRPLDVRIIEDATSVLSDADAAKADAELAGMAPGLTYGQLRAQASKLVLKLDPKAVAKRKERARRETHVRCFREDSGNAGISGRELPSVEALAAMQHIQDRARQLREAGMGGTLEELKARALLDLLREQDSRHTLDDPAEDGPDSGDAHPGQDGSAAGQDRRDSAWDASDLFGADPDEDDPEDGGPEDENPEDGNPGDGGSGGGGSGGSGGSSGPGGGGRGSGTGPVLAALVNITIP